MKNHHCSRYERKPYFLTVHVEASLRQVRSLIFLFNLLVKGQMKSVLFYEMTHASKVRIKKTRILMRSTRSEAFRTIQYLIRHARKTLGWYENCMQNQKLKENLADIPFIQPTEKKQ